LAINIMPEQAYQPDAEVLLIVSLKA